MTKICSKCKIKKDESEFYKDKSTKDKLQCKCKKCSKDYYINNKVKILKQKQNYYNDNKDEILENYKEYYINSKTEILEYKKNYRADNKEQILEYHKNYYIDNKNKIKEQKKGYIKQRRLKDPIFKLRQNISNTINRALKNQNSSKVGESIIKYLPYTINELKQHIESQLEPWMNWNNHGKISNNKRTWNIDHIIPQSLLPYASMEDNNFKKCWALENLRPLESFINIKKGNTK